MHPTGTITHDGLNMFGLGRAPQRTILTDFTPMVRTLLFHIDVVEKFQSFHTYTHIYMQCFSVAMLEWAVATLQLLLLDECLATVHKH